METKVPAFENRRTKILNAASFVIEKTGNLNTHHKKVVD